MLRFEKTCAAIPIPRSNPRSTKWCAVKSGFTDLRLEVGAAHAGNAEAFYLPPRQNEKGSLVLYKSCIRDERLNGFINHSFLAPSQSFPIIQTPSSRPHPGIDRYAFGIRNTSNISAGWRLNQELFFDAGASMKPNAGMLLSVTRSFL